MPVPGWPPSAYSVAQRNVSKVLAFVYASSGKCLELQKRYPPPRTAWTVKRIGPGDLERIDLPDSWFMGVLVCPDDDLGPLVKWAGRRRSEALGRIRFFYWWPPQEEAVEEKWLDAGLTLYAGDSWKDFASFHTAFGRRLLGQVLEDWGD